MTAERIGPNARVVIDYTLRDRDGAELDSSSAEGGEPIVYVHGYGMLVPGLEKALAGLAPGAKKEIVLSPEEAYGERDEELVLEVERTEMPRPEAVALGDELVAEGPDGEEALLRVVEVRPDAVVLDGNHPLAGQALRYSVVVREVRPATEAEIAEAAAGFEEAAQGQEELGETLVQLGRRPPSN
jgi:FKBP-type peptidyl-prolyl cis-trans isomerase SlyD